MSSAVRSGTTLDHFFLEILFSRGLFGAKDLPQLCRAQWEELSP